MIVMHVDLRGNGAFKDFQNKEIIHLKSTIRVAALTSGLTSGKTSVAFGFELPDGRAVLAETSLKMFLTSADMLRAKFGEE